MRLKEEAFESPIKVLSPTCVAYGNYLLLTGGFKDEQRKSPNLKVFYLNLETGKSKALSELHFPLISNYPGIVSSSIAVLFS